MWKVIYIAPTQEQAEKLKKLLGENGFLCQLKAVGTRRNGKAASIEISVPVSEAEEAYEELFEEAAPEAEEETEAAPDEEAMMEDTAPAETTEAAPAAEEAPQQAANGAKDAGTGSSVDEDS